MKLFCKYCEEIVIPETEMQNGQLTAWCTLCGAFIKNLPYEEVTFHFGKYEGQKVKDVDDRQYFKWFLENVQGNKRTKEAIKEKLNGET